MSTTFQVAAVGDGTTDDTAAINSALTAAGERGQWLEFPPGTYRIASDVTFTVPVLFTRGKLKLDSGVTVTFNEPYMNPSGQQCFDEQNRAANVGGGVRVDETSSQDTVCPQDWGALADGTTDDHFAIQQAIDAVTYTSSSIGKVGRVLFSSGVYACEDSIFSGYDWVTKGDWGNRTYACWRGYTDTVQTAQSRKQFVMLEGIGRACLKYTYDPDPDPEDPTKYLVYQSGSSNAKAFTVIRNLTVDGNYNCRGVYCSYHTYGNTIDGLMLYRTKRVGLDWIECWGGRLLNVMSLYALGIAVRTAGSHSCYVEGVDLRTRGQQTDYWPSPTDTTVSQRTGSTYPGSPNYVRTKVWERAAGLFGGNCTEYHNTIVEDCCMGTANFVSVAGDLFTCTQTNHGFSDGDPIYLHADGNKTTVQTPITWLNFAIPDDGNKFSSSGNNLIYRRCTAITKDTIGVFSCQNHGLDEGQWVKIMVPESAGMTELNDIWYRVKLIPDNGGTDPDTFSLWTVWDDDAGTPFTVPLNTFGNDNAGNGSEYIVSSAAGVFLSGPDTRLINTRVEGNSAMAQDWRTPGRAGFTPLLPGRFRLRNGLVRDSRGFDGVLPDCKTSQCT